MTFTSFRPTVPSSPLLQCLRKVSPSLISTRTLTGFPSLSIKTTVMKASNSNSLQTFLPSVHSAETYGCAEVKVLVLGVVNASGAC